MTVRNLQEQAARAERLARGILDEMACKALMRYASECRIQAELIAIASATREQRSPCD
jgi:hypothetical protein